METMKRMVVKAVHLLRDAVVYLRQSTAKQIQENTGSTEYQRNQAEHARQLGWPLESIRMVDEDLGLSGSSTHRRLGYAKVLEWIKSGLVGAVFVAEHSQLGRNLREAIAFVDECRIHDVLIVVDGRINDLRNSHDRFMTTLFLSFAELENDGLRDRLNNGKVAKAMKGIAVSPPPAGFVSSKGKWSLDPDERVRLAISTVLRVFWDERTLVRTVARLVELGVELPRRKGHLVYWVPPTISAVAFIIKNRSYVGDYVFRHRCVDPALGRSSNGRNKDRLSREDEMIIIRDHHEGYVTRERWDEMQRLLANNAPNRDRRNPGPGDALLQGILRCEQHPTRAMRARYKEQLNCKSHYYACEGDLHLGGSRCGTVTAPQLERAVGGAVVQRLSVPRIEAIRGQWREAKASALAEKRGAEVELEVLRQQVRDLERRYESVDPANRCVAADLEAKLEAKKRALKTAEVRPSRVDSEDIFTEQAFGEMVQLCGDVQRVLDAPTTEARDKKELFRTLIKHVVVEKKDAERISAHIVWADDGTHTPLDVRLNAYAYRVIRELHAQGVDPTDIAKRLNEEGVLTLRSNPWTRQAVVMVLWRWRRRGDQK